MFDARLIGKDDDAGAVNAAQGGDRAAAPEVAPEVAQEIVQGAGQQAGVLRVEDYEHAQHRGRTLCGDFRCAARLYYRREARTHGDVVMRVPHFATMPHDTHIENCTQHNPDAGTRMGMNIREALLAGKNILVNVNVDLGFGMGDDFYRAAEPAQENSRYGRFLRAQNHLAISVKSAADVLRVRAALLRSGHEDALARSYVGHRHELRKFDNFFVADDKSKLRTLYNNLARGDGVMTRGPEHVVTGFPRLLYFKPTQKSFGEGRRSGVINGTAQCISRAGEAGVILLQHLNTRDSQIRTDILAHGASWVLAAPAVDRAAARQAEKFPVISWAVRGEAQYIRDQDAPAPPVVKEQGNTARKKDAERQPRLF